MAEEQYFWTEGLVDNFSFRLSWFSINFQEMFPWDEFAEDLAKKKRGQV